jgi:hypothetical protein
MKTTKYTDEDTALLTKLHKERMLLEDIAICLDRTPRSVRAKLTALGLYSKQPYLAKDGTEPKKKIEYVAEIAELLDVPEELIDSLEKCTKFTLKKLVDALTLGAEARKDGKN